MLPKSGTPSMYSAPAVHGHWPVGHLRHAFIFQQGEARSPKVDPLLPFILSPRLETQKQLIIKTSGGRNLQPSFFSQNFRRRAINGFFY
jgi:hypothetical protein